MNTLDKQLGIDKMYISRVGPRANYTSTDPVTLRLNEVRTAQDDACAQDSRLVMAYRGAIRFQEMGYLAADNVHYTQAGYNMLGNIFGEVVASDINTAVTTLVTAV